MQRTQRLWKKGDRIKGFSMGKIGIVEDVSFDKKNSSNPFIAIKRKNGMSFATLDNFLSMGYSTVR